MVAHFTSEAAVPPAAARLVILVSDGVETEETIIPIGPGKSAIVRVFRPQGVPGQHPTVFFLQDDAWRTHAVDAFVEDLVTGCGVAVWLISPQPGAAIHRSDDIGSLVTYALRNAVDYDIDSLRLAVIGEGSAGPVAAELVASVGQRRDARVALQVLVYPLVADIRTNGHANDTLTPSPGDVRSTIAAMGKQAGTLLPGTWPATRLAAMPRTVVLVAEHDILRDGAEAFGFDLAAAGVDVTSLRFNGTEHGFLGLDTPEARAATALLVDALKDVFSAIWSPQE